MNEPITFTLNGSETCTANTDSTGTATCDITAGEPSSSYTLAASFPGDTTTSTPIGSDTSTASFTVNPDTSSLTYTGLDFRRQRPADHPVGHAHHGQPRPRARRCPPRWSRFTIGSGSTAQSCSGTTDANGNVSCTIATVDQPSGTEPINATFAGDSYDTPATATSSLSVTEPTVLTVNPATVTYGGSTTVSGTLTDSNLNQPIANEPVTFTVNGTETCTGTTDSSGVASCPVTPGESTGNYTVTGTFTGDTTQPVPLTTSTNSAAFVVTPAVTTLTYTGANSTTNGQPVVVSGVLTTGSTPLANQPVTLTLGSGSSAQTCPGDHDHHRRRQLHHCFGQPAGRPEPGQRHLPGDEQLPAGQCDEHRPGRPHRGVHHPDGDLHHRDLRQPDHGDGHADQQLHEHSGARGDRDVQAERDAVLHGDDQRLRGGDVHHHAVGAGGTYTLSGSFGGDTTTVPTLLPSTGSGTFVVTKAPTTVTYTGSTSITSGNSPVLSATLTSNGAPVAGQTVTFTVGTGSSAQKCSGTTNSAGNVSCSICMFNQSASPLPVTVSYGGNSYYSTSSTSVSVTVNTPTSLSVSAVTGTTGQPTTVTGTLTNQVTGQGISGQTVTLTLNGTQSCTATTGSTGKASCSVTPNESSGTYPVTGSFAGNTATSTQLLPSTGHNNFVVTPAATSVTYTGATTATNGSSVTAVVHLDEQRHAAERPERGHEPGHREDGAELHRHDDLVRRRLVQHPVGQSGRRIGLRHRELRRQRLLPVGQHVEHRQDRQQRWRRRWGGGVAAGLRVAAAAGAATASHRPSVARAAPAPACDRSLGLTAPDRPRRGGPARHRAEAVGTPPRTHGCASISTVPATSNTSATTAARAMAVASWLQGLSRTPGFGVVRRQGDLQSLLGRPQHPLPHQDERGEDGQAAQHPACPRAHRRPGSWR